MYHTISYSRELIISQGCDQIYRSYHTTRVKQGLAPTGTKPDYLSQANTDSKHQIPTFVLNISHKTISHSLPNMVTLEDIYNMMTTRLGQSDKIMKELKSKLPSHKQGQPPDMEIAELLTQVRDMVCRGMKAHARMEQLALQTNGRGDDLVKRLGTRVSKLDWDVKHFEDAFR